MTRTKEPPIGSTQIPEYKSPPSRILRSLRKGYDNLREKMAQKETERLGVERQNPRRDRFGKHR